MKDTKETNFERFRNWLLIRKEGVASVAIILAIGLLAIAWFRGNFLIANGDMLFYPDRWNTFLRSFFVWDSGSLGSAAPRLIASSIPLESFRVLTQIIGLSLETAEKLWYYLMFTSMGLSMYFLTTVVVKGKGQHLAAVTSALVYMLNPYVFIFVVKELWIFVIFLPLILGLYIKGLDEQKGFKYIFLMCAIWILTSNTGYVNPKYALIHWAPLILYLCFYIIVKRNKADVLRALRFTGILLAVWSALNFYWILPIASDLTRTILSTINVYEIIGRSRLSDYTLGSAPLLQAMRLLGLWSFNSGFKGVPYYYYAPTFSTPAFTAIGFLLPAVAFAALLSKARRKPAIFFGIVTIIGLIVMNGADPPFGSINVYLMTHIPLALQVISNPYIFGGLFVSLGYAFLIGLAVSVLYFSRSKILLRLSVHQSQILKGIAVGTLVFLIAGVYAFPLWNGDVMYPGNDVLASSRFNIPSYYYDAAHWLNGQPGDFNLFALPYSIVGYGAYTWAPNGFNGPDPTESLLNKSVVSSLSGGGIGLEVARSLVGNSTDDLAKILALMNVKYVILHRDANWNFLKDQDYYVSKSVQDFQSLLGVQTNLTLERSFGELDFYRNEYWQPRQIYASLNNILVTGNYSQMVQVAESNYDPSASILTLSDQLTTQQISSIDSTSNVFLTNDFLALLLPRVGGQTIHIPSNTQFINENGNFTANISFSVDITQEYDVWIEMPHMANVGVISASLDDLPFATSLQLPYNSYLSASWVTLGKTNIPEGSHTLTLKLPSQIAPEEIQLIPDKAFNEAYSALLDTLRNEKIVYSLEPQPVLSAAYYAGWKGVINLRGQGDSSMIVFSSPEQCPYFSEFPSASSDGWNALDSTLIYLTTSSSPITIYSILANGKQQAAIAWWQTGTSWRTGWPITIPPHQRAIIQVDGDPNSVSLQTTNGIMTLGVADGQTSVESKNPTSLASTAIFVPTSGNYSLAVKTAPTNDFGSFQIRIDSATFNITTYPQEPKPTFEYNYIGPINLSSGYHNITTEKETNLLSVLDGSVDPINWTNSSPGSYLARFYSGVKIVIRTDGLDASDTLSFPSIDKCPYSFPLNLTGWTSYNSTLVYLTSGDVPLSIASILSDGDVASDVGGVWWATDWMGMGTKPVTFPIVIPPNQKAILQINHQAHNVTLVAYSPSIDGMLFYSLKEGENSTDANSLLAPTTQTDSPVINYQRFDPTHYTVKVNASTPFSLVLSESYDSGWVAYIDGKPVPNQYHFEANGFANGWYINKTGTYTITLDFSPQKLFYIGSAISLITLALCTLPFIVVRVKNKFKRRARDDKEIHANVPSVV